MPIHATEQHTTSNAASNKLHSILEDAVSKGTAPGLVACVFTANDILAQAVAGVRDITTGEPMTLSTTIWMASKSKAVASIAALICVEKFLDSNGNDGKKFDMESHEALSAILPELDVTNDTLMTNMIFDGKDSTGKYKFRRAKVGITLRHLLTHTSGYGGPAFSEELASLYQPTGSLPSAMTGAIEAINTPRLFEAGTAWSYGFSTDWIGLFIERVSGMSLREAYRELVFRPLGITPEELDTLPLPTIPGNRSAIHSRSADGGFKVLDLPFVFFEDRPPEGFITMASGPLHGTIHGFVKFAQCLLNKTCSKLDGKQLLSASLFKEAMSDGLEHYKLSLPRPDMLTSVQPARACTVRGQYYPYDDAESTTADLGEGWSLMQAVYSRAQTANGHSPGTISWSGLANSFYFIDNKTGIGGVIIGQLLPWMDPLMHKLRDEFEKWIYKEFVNTRATKN